MKIEQTIRKLFHETLQARGHTLPVDLRPETVLLESGLDSLGFAILVSKLEQELKYDPFAVMSEPVYPRTYQEFVEVYNKLNPSN